MDVLLEMMADPIGGCVNQLLEADMHRPGSFCLFGRERCRGYHRGLSLVYIALFSNWFTDFCCQYGTLVGRTLSNVYNYLKCMHL